MLAEIHRAEVRELIEADAQLIEVLAPGEHEHEHLAGAINLPMEDRPRTVRDGPGLISGHKRNQRKIAFARNDMKYRWCKRCGSPRL